MNTYAFDSLDLDKRWRGKTVILRGGDHNGTTISAPLTDHGTPVTTSGLTARFCMPLPDNEHYYRVNATYSSGTVSATIDEEAAATVKGRVEGYFQILQGTSVIASTEPILMVIVPSALDGLNPPESIDDMVQEYVDQWLEDHPEATTTIQDGAVTTSKLADGAVTPEKLSALVNALIKAFSHVPDVSFSVGTGITGSGVIGNNKYVALSDIVPCNPGDTIINNTPSRDADNLVLYEYVATYGTEHEANDTFIDRTSLSSGASITFDEGVTGFRMQFGRATSSGISMTQADIDAYYDADYYMKGVSLTEFESAFERTVKGYSPMITTAERASEATGGTSDVGSFPADSIITVGASNIGLTGYPSASTNGQGVYLTFQHGQGAGGNGSAQLYVWRGGSATRWKVAGAWTEWVCTTSDAHEAAYFVGGDSGNDSLTSLLIDLKDNENKKVIYINSGTYDIFAEYMDEVNAGRLEIPQDDVASSSYFYPLNAFVPSNTRLVGLGDVLLSFMPNASEITYGAARTWSPLNLLGNVTVENVSIEVKNGRYCIHDDAHGAYPNTMHVYKNVNCIYHQADTVEQGDLGFNNVIGFGFDHGCSYLFENCHFKFDGSGSHGVFYGHGQSGTEKHPATIVVNNSIVESHANNSLAVRLQTLATTDHGNRIQTKFSSCHIDGGLNFNLNNANSFQEFDVTLLKSGSLNVSHTGNGASNTDHYAVKVFE